MDQARIIKYVPEDSQVIQYDINEAYIAEAEARDRDFELIPDDKKSYDTLMEYLAGRRKIRIAIETRRKANNEGAKAFIEANNKRGKELHALNDPGEERLKAIRQVEDDRVNAIEKVRVDAIQKKIQQIKGKSFGLSTLIADQLKTLIKDIEGTPLEKEEFEEFTGEAQATAYNALIAIKGALETRERLDKQEATQKAEATRLEKIRLEQEAAQKEIDEARAKIDKKNKELDDAKAKLEDEKKAEKDRKDRAEFEKKVNEDVTKKARFESLQSVGLTYPLDDLGTMPDIAYSQMYEVHREAWDKEQNKIFIEKLTAKETADAETQAQQEAMAPDKEKLFILADVLVNIKFPSVESEAAQRIVTWVLRSLEELQKIIKERAENL